jgi:hypothetical protein
MPTVQTALALHEPPPRCLAFPQPGIAFDGLLADACRERAAALEGIEILIDVEPATLRIGPADARRVGRCIALLLDVALASDEVVELDLAARAADDEAGSLVVAVRAFSSPGHEPASACARETDLVRIAVLHANRLGAALLASRREGSERRLTLGLDVRSWSPNDGPVAGAAPRLLVADDNERAQRALTRMGGAAGFRVAVAGGPLDLLRSIDPDETNGAIPEALLIDGGWFAEDGQASRSLAAAIDAAIPAERVALLTSATGTAVDLPAAWRRLRRPLDRSGLQVAFEVGSETGSPRNAAAFKPYSLSR